MCATDAVKSKQVNSGCCVWSKSGCVRPVLLLSFNDATVPKIFSMVRLFQKFSRGYGCTLHLQKLLLLKGTDALVLAFQWYNCTLHLQKKWFCFSSRVRLPSHAHKKSFFLIISWFPFFGVVGAWFVPNWCLSWFVFSWCSLIEGVINKIYYL